MQLEWKSNLDLSALHLAWCADVFPKRCQGLDPVLDKAAEELSRFARQLGVPVERFWSIALPLCIEGGRNEDLAERILVRLLSAPARGAARVADLSMRIADVEREFRRVFPNHDKELPLRMEPFRQLWDSHGPGLLKLIGDFTSPDLLVERAQIFLVQPVIGGGGFSHHQTNRVQVESVLTNVDPRLPETLRLAWLLSQLDFERPVHSELNNQFDLRRIAGLAMIPPTLQAAEELGLAQFAEQELMLAIRLWLPELLSLDRGEQDSTGEPTSHIRHSAQQTTAAELGSVLVSWWDTYQASRPAWRIALAGLDKLLAPVAN